MSGKYELRLIRKRLAEIAKARAACDAIINEDSHEYFRLIEKFNASRNVQEKIALAKKAEVALRKLTTWVSRSDKAWRQKAELDSEAHDLSMRVCQLE